MLGENELPRYHVLRFNGQVAIPDSIIDFKHYFSVNIENLQKKKREGFVCQVCPLYREKISHRFSNYLARIGLPEGGLCAVAVGGPSKSPSVEES